MKRLLVFALVFFSSSSVIGSQQPSVRVSLIHLISQSKELDGRVVAVTGFLSLSSRSEALYLHQEDFLHGLTENSVRLEIKPGSICLDEKLDENYVTVVGVFHAHFDGKAHHSGKIDQIQGCTIWSQSGNPLRKKLGVLRNK